MDSLQKKLGMNFSRLTYHNNLETFAVILQTAGLILLVICFKKSLVVLQ
jgi:hypothetical protein